MADNHWDSINELGRRALQGDTSAYKSFLKLVSTQAQSIITAKIPNNYREDVLQNTLIAIHKNFHTLNANKSVKSWVLAIIRFKINDQLREIYKNWERFEDTDLESIIRQENSDFFENRDLISKVLTKIPKQDRDIVLALKWEGKSIKEVSIEKNLSESNVKILCMRALNKIRKYLEKEDHYEYR
jgi:RNA polymerase sigma-70 factor (ECF subfamily)